MKKILYVHNYHHRGKSIFDRIANEALKRGELVDTNYMHRRIITKEQGQIVEYYIKCIDDDRDYSRVAGMEVNQVIYDEISTFSPETVQLLTTKERLK